MKRYVGYTSVILCTLLLIGFFVWPSDATKIQITAQNVFHTSLSSQWQEIQKHIDLEEEYLLTSFRLEYAPDGELITLNWAFQTTPRNGHATFYQVNKTKTDRELIMTKSRGSSSTTMYGLHVSNFASLLTKEALSVTKPVDCDYISLTLQPLHQQFPQHGTVPVYAVHESKIIGPLKSGVGYLLAVYPMFQESEGRSSGNTDRYYLLGGHFKSL